MAIDKVKVIKVDTGEAQTSVKGLRKELKDLRDTLLTLDEGTAEYGQTLQRAADIQHQLKEQMEEVNASAMDFGQITSNVVKATGGMVAGFQAAKAAMNLLGVENENVIKAMEKMQNLMAITQAIPALDDGVKAFKRLKLAIQGASAGMSGFKKALMSTGIGLAVVAVGTLAANFDKLKTWITGTNEELEKQKKLAMDKHLADINSELDKRLTLEEKIRKAAGQDDLTIAEERVKSIQKEIKEKENLIQMNRREEMQLYNQREARRQQGAHQSVINNLTEKANQIHEKEKVLQAEINNLTSEALKNAQQQLKEEQALADARKIKERQEEAARKAEENRKKAADARKRRIDDEKKAIEELRKKYNDLSNDIALFDANDYEKDLVGLADSEKKSLETIEKAYKKGLISHAQYEKDKNAITKHYSKLREQLAIDEEARKRNESIEAMEKNYTLQQALVQKQYDEGLMSEEEFNARKKELQETYVQDYVDSLQFILDTEKNLTEDEILDLTTKINEARASLKGDKKPDDTTTEDSGTTMAKGISEAINASALALTDFSDNPAWGNILKNVATLTANWDTLHENMQKGGKEAFTAYAQVAAAGLSAVATLMNGLASEQDTSNKKGFESAKKYQIAGATMSMLSGIASAWASSMQLGPIAGPIMGSILSAFMLATGIMQINKIKKQKFEGNGSASAGGTPSSGAITNIQAPVQYTQDVQGASIEGAIKDSKVYVTETDITNTQNRVSVTESEARY